MLCMHAGIGFLHTIPDGGERRWLEKRIGTLRCSGWSWLGGVGWGGVGVFPLLHKVRTLLGGLLPQTPLT